MRHIEGVEVLHHKNNYALIKENDGLLIVHDDYFHQEAAILLKVADNLSDWSESMLIESAMKVVDHLGEIDFYPDGSK